MLRDPVPRIGIGIVSKHEQAFCKPVSRNQIQPTKNNENPKKLLLNPFPSDVCFCTDNRTQTGLQRW